MPKPLQAWSALLLTLVAIASAAFVGPAARTDDFEVSLELIEEATGRTIPGVIRITRGGGTNLVRPAHLVARGWGLEPTSPISEWCVVPGRVRIELPRAQLVLEAIAGLETERAQLELDLTTARANEVRIPIRRFTNQRAAGWFSANTHLHLRNLSRADSDRYLREIPAADDLDLLFISYLERAGDDRTYITNEYPVGRLKELDAPGVQVSNGEEHRHNFGPQGEGYGHVMLLGIRELVRPVSIGAGISGIAPDAPAIATGIDAAHEQGATAIWCHNNWGYEDVPNWLAGRLDAQNIFDGGSHGGYAESYYRYLNAGLRVPFSTGTDWFQYDFSRAYASVRGELTPETWLAALRAGRTFITNGPLLELQVQHSDASGSADGAGGGQRSAQPGDTVALEAPGMLTVSGLARGRLDFGSIELVQNGRVIESSPTRPAAGHYESRLALKLAVTDPCWLAIRIDSTANNEYGQPLFAHTSPVYVSLGGRSVEIRRDLEFLRGELESARSAIRAKAQFDSDAQRAAILGAYDRAIAQLHARL